MNKKEAEEVDKSKNYKGVPFPFAFVLAPSGKKNFNVLKDLQSGEVVDLINEDKKIGELTVEEVFPIDTKERLLNIYGTTDSNHPGVKNTMSRLGDLAVCGDYHVEYPIIEGQY